jgi:diamine N-acetyltransferase
MLKGQHIYLRGIEIDDLSFLSDIENNPDNWIISDTLIPFSDSSLKAYILSSRDLTSDKQVRFIVCKNESDKPIGAVDIFEYDPVHRKAGVGILINEDERKKGFANQALKIIIEYAFNFLSLHQLWANIQQANTQSVKLFKSNGFELSGVKKEWNLYDGKWLDEGFYQLFNPREVK